MRTSHAAWVAERDRVDVTAVYAEEWRSMVRLAVLLVDDVAAAEDVVQDAFVSLYRNRQSLRNAYAAKAYVRAAVLNGSRSALRHRHVVRRSQHLVADDTGPADQAAFDAVTDDPQMLAAVRELPERMREVLVLRYWVGMSEAEIASTLAISAGTVKSAASRGLDKLRDALGGQS